MPPEVDTPAPERVELGYPDASHADVSSRGVRQDQALERLGSPSGVAMRFCYFVGDALSIMTGLLAASLTISLMSDTWWRPLSQHETKLFVLFAFGMLCVAVRSGIYNAVPPRPVRQFRSWTIGSLAVLVGVLLATWLFDLSSVGTEASLVVATAITHLSASFARALCRIWFGKRPWWGTRILVVGADPAARDSILYMLREPQWGLRPVGYLAEDHTQIEADLPLPCLGLIEDLDEAAEMAGVRRALVALHPIDLREMREQFSRSDARIHHWIIIPNSNYFSSLWAEWSETARMPAVTVRNRLARKRARVLKRAFDVVVAGSLTLALLPLLVLTTALIRMTSEGPVVYRHRRIGKGGRTFAAWKFRTMAHDSEAVLERYFDEHPELRGEWESHQKLKHDPRVTTIGRFLRTTSLDELPQLWNVLKGEMSLVGPRPIIAAEAEKYHELFGHYRQVTPGITGLWQVSGRNDTSYEERVDLDAYYVENWSLWLDLYILACTVKVVLLREGAY